MARPRNVEISQKLNLEGLLTQAAANYSIRDDAYPQPIFLMRFQNRKI